MVSDIDRFNVRVYGILINQNGELLLVHEKMGEHEFTKFPGGGLEFGEGLKDCLIREFKEETSIDVEVREHFYTTDFFQQSAFRTSDQIISIYFRVFPLGNTSNIRLDEFEIHGKKRIERLQFRWVNFSSLQTGDLSLPIDQVVCGMLLNEHHS